MVASAISALAVGGDGGTFAVLRVCRMCVLTVVSSNLMLALRNFNALQKTIAEAIHDQFQLGHFLQVPPNRTTRLVRSTTRAEAWARAINEPNSKIDVDLPPRARGSSPSRAQLEIRVSEDLMRLACTEEINIDYINVARLFTEYFNEQSTLGFGKTHIIDRPGHEPARENCKSE
ncbi:hypothetical protein L211DRAFT_866362 [Terfezia boudieri ATCC MYA-4762]|uniref:Uncharacterized protein n=1 Tax=Terfezia boudieri ATCC MYA-4762 TaxID=1051890 RepID=A0A3N4L5E4_9PEZI|nr:hypothetical protein L211DRAFT_879898 [Terfezia boudieri ATCC MYA-4762]RPB26431.1 hypothetical protein L211DRAFT_866362 [Terfezia boudieri ATCC MYA-4762]